MNKLKKIILLGGLAMLFLGAVCAKASTSSALSETYQFNMSNSYGYDYTAPFAVAADDTGVNLTTGAVSLDENLVSLPGKNGLDFNYGINYLSSRKDYVLGEYTEYGILEQMYWTYTYTNSSNVQKSVLVKWDEEADVREEIEASLKKMANPSYSKTDLAYYKPSQIVPGISGTSDVTLYLDMTVAPIVERYNDYLYVVELTETGFDYGWENSLPRFQIAYHSFEENYFYKGSFIDETGAIKEFATRLIFEDGSFSSHAFEICDSYITDPQNRRYTFTYEHTSTGVGDEYVTHEAGFQYNIAFTDDEGKKYYAKYAIGHLNWYVTAIEDRWGNRIIYQPTDGGGIIDSMGRRIIIEDIENGQSVKLFENSIQKEIARYTCTVEQDENDPYNIFKTDDTYVLSVYRLEDENSSITESDNVTAYRLKRDEWVDETRVNASYLIESITYPTDAKRVYAFEEKSGRYLFKEFRMINTYLTDTSGIKMNNKTYAYTKDMTKTFPHNSTIGYSVSVTEEGGGTSEYAYDSFERIEETYDYNSDETVEYIYEDISFSDSNHEKNARKPYIRIASSVFGTYDCDFTSGRRVLYEKNPYQPITVYTYGENYIPTQITVTQDKDTILKTVNTLTEDNKNIAISDLYENDALKTRTYYTYDSFGNMTKQTVKDAGETVLSETNLLYTYNSDGSYRVDTWIENVSDADGVVTERIQTTKNYDIRGRLASETDANGNTVSYEYDALNRIVKAVNPDLTFVTYDYNTKNNEIIVTDENSNSQKHKYNSFGLYDSVYVEPDNSWVKVYEYSYNNRGAKIGEVQYRNYDANGNATDKYTASYTLNTKNFITAESICDINGTEVYGGDYTYAYTDSSTYLGKFSTVNTSTKEVVINGEYDFAEVSMKTDEIEHVYIYGDGKLIYSGMSDTSRKFYQTVNVSGINTLSFKGSCSTQWTVSGIKGSVRTQKITFTPRVDSNQPYAKSEQYLRSDGKLYKETLLTSGGEEIITAENKYDWSNNVIKATVGDRSDSYEYDYMGNVIRHTNAQGSSEASAYDLLGNCVQITDYMGNTTSYTYDKLGRQLTESGLLDENTDFLTKNYYDANGNMVKTMQKADSESFAENNYTYDSRNRLTGKGVKHSDSKAYGAKYVYDNVGNITYMYKGMNILNLNETVTEDTPTVCYEYDSLNRMVKLTDAMGYEERYTYDLAGNVISMTDRNGTVTTTAYNLWNKPTTTTASKGEDTKTCTNVYSKGGLLVSTTDDCGTTTYTYNNLWQNTRQSNPSWVNEYTYDVYGNRTSYTLTSNNAQVLTNTYTYDSLNRVTALSSGGVTTSYTYNANSLLISEQTGAQSASYTYNLSGLLTNKTTISGEDTLLSTSYTYRNDGNIITKADSEAGTISYEYTSFGAVFAEMNEDTDLANVYTYDKFGNVASSHLSEIDGVRYDSLSYTYDKNQRLTRLGINAAFATSSTVTNTYDADGNLLTSSRLYTDGDSEITQNTFDLFGNKTATQITEDGEVITNAAYTYNSAGIRTSKTVNGVTTTHLLDGANVAADVSGSGVQKYIRGNSLISMIDPAGAVSNYITDGHGDVRALASTSGAVTKNYSYTAYGIEYNQTASTNPFRYCGEYQDLCSGLIYLRNRYYDPSIGRFITEDPARDGLNWYVYANNNPVNAIDPSGLRTYFINGINNSKEEGSPQYSIDFAYKLTEKGVEDVRTIGVYNGTGTITGVGQVAMEMVNKGKYAENVANKILEDLENDPLADGEELNLIGYSGGGQIVLNVCELLQGKATVDNSVLIGTPVSELTLNNTGETTMIYAGFDPLSWNVSWYPISLEFAGWIGHTSYFNKDNIGKVADLVNKHID